MKVSEFIEEFENENGTPYTAPELIDDFVNDSNCVAYIDNEDGEMQYVHKVIERYVSVKGEDIQGILVFGGKDTKVFELILSTEREGCMTEKEIRRVFGKKDHFLIASSGGYPMLINGVGEFTTEEQWKDSIDYLGNEDFDYRGCTILSTYLGGIA